MSLPDFIGIGCQRCGTTWLYHMLKQHPEVQMARSAKELHFFDRYYARGQEWYENQFPSEVQGITGEITPKYIYQQSCPERIYEIVPGAKLIALFRNPIERLISQYKFEVRERGYKDQIDKFIRRNDDPLERGLYAQQLQRYLQYFSWDQIHPIMFERMIEKPKPVLHELFTFLNLQKDQFVPDEMDVQRNTSRKPRMHFLYIWLKRLSRFLHDRDLSNVIQIGKRLGLKRLFFTGRTQEENENRENQVKINAELEQFMVEYYREDVRQFGELTGLDIDSYWEHFSGQT